MRLDRIALHNSVTAPKTRRRARMERQVHRRLRALGIES